FKGVRARKSLAAPFISLAIGLFCLTWAYLGLTYAFLGLTSASSGHTSVFFGLTCPQNCLTMGFLPVAGLGRDPACRIKLADSHRDSAVILDTVIFDLLKHP